jgi:cyclase
MSGYDLDLITQVSRAVSIPLVACGGAGSIDHLAAAIAAGASAVAAGSLFVFTGPRRAVLINYPSAAELRAAVASVTS